MRSSRDGGTKAKSRVIRGSTEVAAELLTSVLKMASTASAGEVEFLLLKLAFLVVFAVRR